MNIPKSRKALYIVVSVFIAAVFWLYVDNMGSDERDIRLYNIPVSFVGENEELAERGLMIVSGTDTKINLHLRGRRQTISKINGNNIRIQVDVSGLRSTGEQRLDWSIVYPGSVLPSSVTILSASMYKIPVTIGELSVRTVPIEFDINGSVPDGYMLRECVFSPSTLTISGTEEEVGAVDHAQVEINLKKTTSSYSEYLTYRLVDADNRMLNMAKLRCSENKVRVEVPIVILKELPLQFEFLESGGSMESDIEYEITPESISVSGEEDALEKLEQIDVAQVDLSDVLGDDTLEYEIPIPGGCINESGTETVKLRLRFKNLSTRVYHCTNITFSNVPDGFLAEAVTQSMDVTLRGREEDLEKINEMNLRMVADLSEMSAAAGTYTVKAKVYVNGGDNVGAIGAYQIGYRLVRA